MEGNLITKEDLVEFFARNSIYPMVSSNGNIFFHKPLGIFIPENFKVFFEENFKSKNEIKNLRKEIKVRAKALRENLPISEWVMEERPREMLVKDGAENLPLSKLLAIIIRTGKSGVSAEELAKRLLNKFGSLRAIDGATIEALCEIDGIGFAKAVEVKAALEIGKKFMREQAEKTNRIRKPDDVIDYVREYYAPYRRDANKEFFSIILLDIKNKPVRSIDVSKGTINMSLVDIKEIVKEVSLNSASSLILVHNHPSGDVEPSVDDKELTSKIVDACKMFDIKVLDHIIIGKNDDDFFSFTRAGLIK